MGEGEFSGRHNTTTPPSPKGLMKMLIYIGNGFLPGIPARDLSNDEVKKFGGVKFLLSTGLYAKPKKKKEIKIVVEEGNNGRK